MITIGRILCPVDFSEHSRRSFEHAVALARWYESTITVLHVVSAYRIVEFGLEGAGLDYVVLSPKEHAGLVADVGRFIDCEASHDVPVEIVVTTGDATREILRQSVSMAADLIVLGTHGRSGFEHLMLGSITEKILRKAECPVLSVPHDTPGVPTSPVVFKRILCPVDFSDCSMRALIYALSLAQEADAHLTLLHVSELLYETDDAIHVAVINLEDYRRQYEQESRARLEQSIPEAVRAYCRIDTLVTSGSPYREILRVAAEQQSELIVMGVRGRGAIERLLFGSTTNHVVRQATCPVMTLSLPVAGR